MANTTPDNIYYPVVGDALTPLATRFSTMATSVQTALDSHPYRPADHAALNALTGMANGAMASVQEGGALFEYNGTVWVQKTYATFASASARDTAYAKASATYRVANAMVYRTDTGRTERYAGSTAGWVVDPIIRFAGAGPITNSNGDAVITHGLVNAAGTAIAPTSVQITNGIGNVIPDRRTYAVHTITTTTFTVRAYRQDSGGVLASNGVDFFWAAFA